MTAKSFRIALAIFFAVAIVTAAPPAHAAEPAAAAPEVSTEPYLVRVITKEYAFEAPSELPSGWTTFRLENQGEEPHFLALWRLPEDKTFDEYWEEVAGPFFRLGPKYEAGEMEREEFLQRLGAEIPDWFRIQEHGMGGVGLTSPGRTAQTTVKLVPGTYVMECYVTNPEHQLHNERGMLRPLVVTEEDSGAAAPEADIEMTLSNYEIVTKGELTPGRHRVRVVVTEQPEGVLGHDVHLARLQEDTRIEDVVAWMDWVDALESPAPVEFLGGAEQVPVGHVSYFTIELEPGRYAWISEGYAQRGMVREFRVE